MTITPQQYTEKRDELVRILEATTEKLNSLPNEYPEWNELQDGLGSAARDLKVSCDELSAISRKVREDQFRIQLISRFQGGKSTTANALSGGRVLSPMGTGVSRCSATVVRIQNVIDDKDVGAWVKLRSNVELQKICLPITGSIDLNDAEQRREELAKFVGVSSEIADNLPQELREAFETKRDELQVVSLILHFYDNPYIVQMREQAGEALELRIDPGEAGKYAAAPAQYIKRFERSNPSVFKAEEVLFPFVGEILFKVKAENLERIGAVITDTPGLFANDYDTRVTETEMARTDAVWFLGDARQLGQDDTKAISSCLELCGKNIFFSANIKENRVPKQRVEEEILGMMRTQIKNMGVEQPLLFPYHALLALFSFQAGALQGKLDPDTEQWLRGVISFKKTDGVEKSLRELWQIGVRRSLVQLHRHDEDDPHPVVEEFKKAVVENDDAKMLAIARRESGLDEILTAIEQFVLDNKAESTLIDRGAIKAKEAIQGNLEHPLEQLESVARTESQKSAAEYESAKEKLDKFMKEAEEIVAPYKFGHYADALDRSFVDDMYDYVFVCGVKEIAKDAAPLIRREANLLGILSDKTKIALEALKKFLGYSKSDLDTTDTLEKRCAGIVNCVAENVIQKRLLSWLNEVGQKKRPPIIIMAESIALLQNNLEQKWRLDCAGNQKLEGISNIKVDSSQAQIQHFSEITGQILSHALLSAGGDVGRGLLLGALGGGAGLAVLYLLTIFPPVAILVPIAMAIRHFASTDLSTLTRGEDAVIEKMRNTLVEGLSKAFSDEKNGIINRLLDTCKEGTQEKPMGIAQIRFAIVSEMLEKPLRETHRFFENDYKNAKNLATKSENERKRIADFSKAICERTISPLVNEIDTFISETRQLFVSSPQKD